MLRLLASVLKKKNFFYSTLIPWVDSLRWRVSVSISLWVVIICILLSGELFWPSILSRIPLGGDICIPLVFCFGGELFIPFILECLSYSIYPNYIPAIPHSSY